MSLTTTATAGLQRTSDPHGILHLLTITGAGIAEPIRLVDDTRNLVSNGETFIGLPFEMVLPKEAAKEVPRVQLRIDNVGRELIAVFEALEPGAELTATVGVIYRSEPDTVYRGFTAPLSGIRANVFTVTATVGAGEQLRRAVVNIRFDPFTAPGLFPD